MVIRASSIDVIGSLDDLLMQIMLRLPLKSLMRFKLVSKHWKSLITSHRFTLMRYPNPNPVVGLICPLRNREIFHYVRLDATNPIERPFTGPEFQGDIPSYWVHQSCNGLLLCCSLMNHGFPSGRSPIRNCYVYNPTTKCFREIPRPGVTNGVPRIVHGVNMAFDFAKSPLYKLVSVRGSEFAPELFQIEVYSSESGVWRVCGERFSATAKFDYGVYWNGSIHWVDYERKELLYFDFNEEKLGKMSLPIAISGFGKGKKSVAYFGESSDHLHVIETFDALTAFDVHELKRDYSEWFVKYRVDLTMAAKFICEAVNVDKLGNTSFYELAEAEFNGFEESTHRISGRFSVLSLVRVEEESSFLVLRACGKVIRFNLLHNTFEEISGIGGDVVLVQSTTLGVFYRNRLRNNFKQFEIPQAFEHILSLASV